MKNILYIGNKLNNNKSNVSSINVLGELLEEEGYNMVYSSSKNNKILRLMDMIFACWINRKNTDFVLIDTYSTLNFYFALIISQLCRLLGLKYIPKLSGGNLPERLRTSPFFSRLVFKNAYKLVSPSIYLKEAFEAQQYSPVYYIPNSLVIENYPYLERSFDSIRLFWVRSISKIYNPQLALKILKQLKDEGYAVSLCLVGPDTGDGTFNELKSLTKKLNVEVLFTGKLSKREWTELAKDYNIFINTTNFDNMPVSVIEAMALGLPIVSTNVGGMSYLIENGVDGLLMPPDDVEGFCTAIKNVVNNPVSSKAMSLNARKKTEKFDWNHVKKLWFDVLSHDSSESLT